MKVIRKKLIAEFTGTFFMILFGCGSIIVNQSTGAISHLGVAIVWGIVVAVMISATGHISMAHFNPAVTIAFAVTDHFPKKEVLPYIIAQVTGALLACAALFIIFEQPETYGASQPAGSMMQSFMLELFLTTSLMFVIVAVATDQTAPGPIAPIMIGATVALNALWAGPISGASMNPARSIAPAIFQGAWGGHWLYWAGPILGAMLGALLYNAIRRDKEETEDIIRTPA